MDRVSSNHISPIAVDHESSDWEQSNAATKPVANEIVVVINEKQSNTTNDVEQALCDWKFWMNSNGYRTHMSTKLNATQWKLNNILENIE